MLLNALRQKARSIFIYVIFAIIIVVFIFYFGWGGMREKQESWILKVNDHTISYDAYLRHYNQLLDYYQRLSRGKLDRDTIEKMGIKQLAYDNLIKNMVLLETADKMNLNIPELELKEAIEKAPVFQNNGKFDVERYKQMLRQSRITPKDFEAEQRQELLIFRIRSLIQDGVKFSNQELWEQFVWENEKTSLEYIEINPETVKTQDDIKDEEIKNFYEAHKEEFRVPEKIKIKYIKFNPKDFEKNMEITHDEIAKYHQDFPEEHWEPEKIRARHILVRVEPKAPKKERENAKKKAEDILAKIKKGEPFDEMARQHSQDKATAQAGGDLGFFPRGQTVKPFEEEAFKLKPGEVSGIVETKVGLHIIKVDEIKEEGTKPLEEVEEDIRKKLIEEKTRELIKKEAYRAYRTALKSKDLKGCADKIGLNIIEPDYFSRDEGHPIFGGSEDLTKEVFLLDSGEIAYPFSISGSYYLIELLDKKKSHIPELEEVKEDTESILKKQNKKETARRKAEDLLERLKGGNSMEDIAKNEKLTIKETGLFSRSRGSIPHIGDSSRLTMAAFSLTLGNFYPEEAFEINEKYYLVKLKQREEALLEDFTDKREEYRKKYLFQKNEKYLDDWLNNARLHSNVVVNTRLTP